MRAEDGTPVGLGIVGIGDNIREGEGVGLKDGATEGRSVGLMDGALQYEASGRKRRNTGKGRISCFVLAIDQKKFKHLCGA